MNCSFEYSSPETVGISSEWLAGFLDRLDAQDLPLHSALIMRHGKICMETYYKPYTRDTLHRMFSVTKSLVALAVGLLEADGKLSLDDKIVSYFPEKQPENGPYEYTAMLTIRQMLTMNTCHNKTTYKAPGVTDWVGSFFTVPPTHVPGTNFSYDTSSTHTLAALVEKLSGMSMLDYLRTKCLDRIGFSKEAFILTDPNGVSMGGSGLCATPMDILKVLVLIANDGCWEGEQLLPAQFIKDAKKRHSDPYGKQGTLEELQGYGYQIWTTRYGGYVLFGMGGQLALHVPDKDIFMVTTADAQARQGGVQLIYDAFWDEIYKKIDLSQTPADCRTHSAESKSSAEVNCSAKSDCFATQSSSFPAGTAYAPDKRLLSITGAKESALAASVNDTVYLCDKNSCGVTEVSVHFNEAHDGSGVFSYTNQTGNHSIAFRFGDNAIGTFPDYQMRYAASGAWRTEQTFFIRVQIIDTSVGSIYIILNFKDDYVTVMFRKIEETLFTEYNGVFSGKAKNNG